MTKKEMRECLEIVLQNRMESAVKYFEKAAESEDSHKKKFWRERSREMCSEAIGVLGSMNILELYPKEINSEVTSCVICSEMYKWW